MIFTQEYSPFCVDIDYNYIDKDFNKLISEIAEKEQGEKDQFDYSIGMTYMCFVFEKIGYAKKFYKRLKKRVEEKRGDINIHKAVPKLNFDWETIK